MSPGEPSNPYVGPYSFRAEDADLFFGRDREVESLMSLVIAESIVLFFAQSGTGKTSLIQARLLPDLRAAGFDVLPVARVGAEPPAGTSPANVYVFSALCSLAPETEAARLQGLTLGAYLWTLPERDDQKARRVLVFDQFEEILPPRRRHWEEREDFFLQLRQALQDEPSLSVLLVMREDNLAELETYAPLLPGKLRTRFRMESLRRDDAIDAVAKPAETRRPFEHGVAEQLVDDLRRVEVEGEAESYRGEFVEPLQLQVVCYELWEKLRERPGKTITAVDLAACGDVGQALESFYERAVDQAAERSGVSLERIRRWCGHALITPRRLRGQVDREEKTTAGLDNRAIDELVKTRLIRKQEIRGGIWYELVHDRFIEPVLRVNERHLQEESTPLRRDAEVWNKAERDPSYLYRGQKLADSLAAAPPDPGVLSEIEKSFLSESQAQEARRSIVQGQQAARLRRLVIVLAVMLVVVTALASYAFRESLQSNSRELAAEAISWVDDDPGYSLRSAVDAVSTAETLEAEAALYRALNASRALDLWSTPMKSANAVAFSPDGSCLAAVGDGGEANLIRETPGGRVVKKLAGHTAAVTSVAFSPDGRWLATGDSEGTVLVRKATGEPVLPPLPLSPEKVNVNGLAFSPDGKTLAVASDSPVPTLWSTDTGQKILELKGGHEDLVWDVAFSGDGRHLATGGEDKRVILWDLTTGKPRVLGEHADAVTGVAFRPDKPGEPLLLASSSKDRTTRLWDLDSGSFEALYGHAGEVWDVAFNPDGTVLATASFDGSAKIWDVVSKEELFTLSPGAGEVVKVAFNSKQGLVATASHSTKEEENGQGVATIWTVLVHDEAQSLFLAEQILGTAFKKDGFAAFGGSGRGILWNPTLGTRDRTLCLAAAPLLDVSFSDGGDYVACTPTKGGVVVARSEEPGAALFRLSSPGAAAKRASYSPAGQLLATVSEKTLKLWEFQGSSWKEIKQFVGDAPLWAVAFSKNGRKLVAGLGNGSVVILDTEMKKILTLSGHQSAVLAVAFSPDGTRLATGSLDRTAKLWDLARAAEIATFPGHRAAVSSVAFNRDGTMLATGDTSGTIRLETLDLQELVARARRRLAKQR